MHKAILKGYNKFFVITYLKHRGFKLRIRSENLVSRFQYVSAVARHGLITLPL